MIKTIFPKWLCIAAAASVTALATVATTVSAQDYPNRQIRLVNPYAPGGSTDPVIRPVATKLQEMLGQAVFIDNKPGAGTNIGSEIVAKAKPDGYTLLLATSSLAISPSLYKGLTYDPVKDLQPVVMLVNAPFTLAVSGTLPIKNVQELIAYAKANPGKLSYGSSGNGGAIHLGMELFKSLTKTDMLHVPYKGSGQSLNGLLAGDIQVMLSPEVNFTQHAKTGRIRMLAVAASKRVEGLDLPTVAESGVTGFESGVWMALFAPAGTPKPIVDRINANVNQILKDPSVADAYQKMGMVPGSGSADELTRFYLQDVQRWPQVVKQSGAKIE